MNGKLVGVPVSENLTLHAKWKGDQYTVTLNVNGGDALSGDSTKSVTYGQPYGVLPAPTRTGYTFAGWYTEKTGGTKVETDTVVQAVEDHELFARWKANTYNVTFDPNYSGADEKDVRPVTYGDVYGELPKPTRTGYNFVGWYTATGEDGKKVDANTRVETAGEHTLYAKWTAGTVTYTVKHLWQNVENDEYTEHETETPSGTAMTEVTATPKTYTGFTCVTSGDELKATVKPDGTTVIEIKYDRLTYTVKWMNDNVELKKDENVKYGATPKYTGTTPTKDSTDTTVFEFAGWSTAEDGSNPMPDNFTVTEDVTFYAQFISKDKTGTVSFDANGGTVNPTSQEAPYLGTYGTLPTPERAGYNFAGWYTDKSGGTVVTETTIVETDQPHTLYAHWTGKQYTVTFDANGGVLSGNTTITVTCGERYGELPTPTRKGYYFKGWFLKPNGVSEVTKYSRVEKTEDHNLYAYWERKLLVGGKEVTEENCSDVFSNGKVSYNFDTNTLTLNGYSYNGNCTERNKGRNAIIHYTGTGTETLTIVVNGSNTLINDPPEGTTAYGIYVDKANLTIQGSGALDVTAKGDDAVSTYGIFVGKTLTISGNCAINAKANMFSSQTNQISGWYAISANTLKMEGGTVTATTNYDNYTDKGYALILDTISITGGSFTAKGYRAVCSRPGVAAKLGTGVTAVASKTEYNGSDATEYERNADLSGYKYFHASSNP